MLLNFQDVPASDRGAALGDADLCIVGAGIAGLLLAEQLSRCSTMRILVLEAGASQPEPLNSKLTNSADLQFQADRVVALGGCSTTWGGQLLPLPKQANWPVSPSELTPFLADIEKRFHVDQLPFQAELFFRLRGRKTPSLAQAVTGTRAHLSKFIPFHRRNLAKTIAQQLRRRPHVRLVLHAGVRSVELAQDGQSVEGLRVIGPEPQTTLIRAKRYVLAAGAVETVRLLLAAWADAGLTPPKALGRGFCNSTLR